METQTAPLEGPPAATTVKVRFDQFDALCTAKGWNNDYARARALRISHPHLSRVRAGRVGVGGKFIGNVLAGLGVTFEAVFERVSA